MDGDISTLTPGASYQVTRAGQVVTTVVVW